MSIHRELLYFRTEFFCRLMNRINSTYGRSGFEQGVIITAKSAVSDPWIFQILDVCGGWNAKTIEADIDSDSALAVFCLILASCDQEAIEATAALKNNSPRSVGVAFAKAVYDGLEEPGNELLLEWRPPATSSALYLIRPENLASGDADDLAICSNMILRERDLINLIHG